MPAAPQAPSSQKFKIEKIAQGDVTFLAMSGVVDETFEGKKIADSVKTQKLVLSLRGVRRFASWGMAEWMSFLRGLAEHDLYIVECSPYAVNQMNLVTGLMGHGKLTSFYAPYRCGRCGEEFEDPMVVPLDRDAIRDIANIEKTCATCGGIARMDKYPAGMYAAIAERPPFDIDDEVVTFLRSRFKYEISPNVTRFRAFGRSQGNFSYIRLAGSLTTLQPEAMMRATKGTTIVDLGAAIFEPDQLGQWRTYVTQALQSQHVADVQLHDCPPGFLERAVEADDLGKLKIRSFALEYHCPTCETTTTNMIDVAENLEQLAEGSVPMARCPTCHSVLVAPATEAFLLLRRLPARERDPQLEKFVARARGEDNAKLEDVLTARAIKPTAPGTGVSRNVWIGSAVAALAIGGLGIAALIFYKQRGETQVVTGKSGSAMPVGVVPPTPTVQFQRPEWIESEIPSTGYCRDFLNRMTCVGISAYRPNRSDSVAEANDAALEAMVNEIALKVTDPFFKDRVVPAYNDARKKALDALQALDTDRNSPAYAAASDVLRKARRRVVEILQASGGAAVPAQRSDWYWEEYQPDKGSGANVGPNEFLVFVRYDVTLDAVKALVQKYSTPVPIGASAAITAFPELAWTSPEFTGGAELTKVGKPFAGTTIAEQSYVLAVNEQRIPDASVLARKVEEWQHAGGSLKLTVKPADGPAHVVDLHH